MKVVKLIAVAAIATGVLATSAPVFADANCDVNPSVQGISGVDLKNKSIVLNGNKADVHVTVTGEEGCEKTVSVASWQWPTHLGLPIKSQVLYKTNTQTFGLGEHVISVEVPDCYWQVDLVEGSRPTAADGTADYQIGEPNDKTDRLMDAAYGGEKVCFAKPGEPTTTGPITPPSNPLSPVSSIPSTGTSLAATLASVTGLTASFALAYNLIRTRKTK